MATAAPITFIETPLISDVATPGVMTDPNMVNPWGISYGPTSPFWVSDNNTGSTSIDLFSGAAVTVKTIPAVTIPGPTPGTTSSPTGQVFNPFPSAFAMPSGNPSTFLFATRRWHDCRLEYTGTQASILVNDSANVGAGDA